MSINWSPQQLAIFSWFATGAGNLLVRARAGTGKTTTILEGIGHAPEEKILLAAFNKRIATELSQKLRNPAAEAKTLHSLGFAYIRRQWSNVRVDDNIDFERARAACGNGPDAIVVIVKKLAAFGKNMAPFGTVAELAAIAEERDCVADEDWEEEGWTVEKIAGCALKAMQLAAACADRRIGFDDMLFVPVANNFCRPWYNMVVIDEAQDMNYTQLLLAQKACKKGGRVVVVGDDRQAIYDFRGADAKGIDRLKKELSATELTLTITRRCPKAVVARAAAIVTDFEAAPEAPEGIVDGIDKEKLYEAGRVGDFVLSRKNAPLMGVCLRFLRQGIPARIEGRDIGAGLLAIVKKLNAKSVPDFLKKVESWKARQTKRAEARKAKEGVSDRINDQAETLTALAEGAASIDEVRTRITNLFQDSDSNPRPAVVCSTVHKAKGLETDRVFVLESTLKRGRVEEENICYVAFTRAKAHLTLVQGDF